VIDLVLPGGTLPLRNISPCLTALGLGKLRAEIDFNSGVSANKLSGGALHDTGDPKFP